MIQGSGSYKVSIFGDQYTIKTDESPELIVQAAALVDSTMKEIACASKFDAKSIAVLAALRIAHQVVSAGKIQANNEALISSIDQELMKLGFNIQNK
jgi:cell division protein ZapA (FtsZ GTPase activity inhibitor)